MTQTPTEVLREQTRTLRKEHGGLTARQLADRVSSFLGDSDATFQQTTVSKIERNDRGVSLDEALWLAAALDVSPIRLIFPDDDGASVRIAEHLTVTAAQARRWVQGLDALPGTDADAFHTERSYVVSSQDQAERRYAVASRVLDMRRADLDAAPDDPGAEKRYMAAQQAVAEAHEDRRRAWDKVERVYGGPVES